MHAVQEFAAPESSAAESSAAESSAAEPSAPTGQARVGTASAAEQDERVVASVATLHQQFPQADPETVRALVDQGFAEFGRAKVTTCVPVLVLHACQEQLRRA